MNKLAVGSLFSGIGGFDLGLERAGFEVRWQAEIDPFCNKVLAAHWPGVTRYGDVRDIGAGRLESGSKCRVVSHAGARTAQRCDLIVGGFPCQDLSVAGKRAGLDGARSGLWFEFHRILRELRPAACLIENVPGLLSSNSGRDFGVILTGLEELWPGRWGWAVLDSQHFGVAQRRRRLYVVAGLRADRIAQVLSLCQGSEGHPQTRRETGEEVAATIRGRSSGAGVNEPGRGGEDDSNLVVVSAQSARDWKGLGFEADESLVLAHEASAQGQLACREDVDTLITHSLTAEGFDAGEDGTGRGTPLISVRTANTGANGQAVAGVSVRRLTPTECERLQGFPDGWTAIDGAKDGPRYKALGNAVTVPVIEYIGRRLMEVLEA